MVEKIYHKKHETARHHRFRSKPKFILGKIILETTLKSLLGHFSLFRSFLKMSLPLVSLSR